MSLRDAIISRRSETVIVTTDYITIRCAKCSHEFERSIQEWSKTFGCPRCRRRCRIDTAFLAAEAFPDTVAEMFGGSA
ncbi:MAG: hypothetical protein ACRDPY_32240 [Streptosporangiaceae bacterium]